MRLGMVQHGDCGGYAGFRDTRHEVLCDAVLQRIWSEMWVFFCDGTWTRELEDSVILRNPRVTAVGVEGRIDRAFVDIQGYTAQECGLSGTRYVGDRIFEQDCRKGNDRLF